MIDDDPPDTEPDREPSEEGIADDAGDPKQVERKVKRVKLDRREADEFWRGVFVSPVGRREMWGIIGAQAHAFEERFACGPNGFPQSEATWFHAGEQALGQRLYQSWFLIDPEGVMKMLREHDPRFPKPGKA